MKLFYAIITILFISNCSFDNKTGIWKNENNLSKEDNGLFKDFETLSSLKENFTETINIKKNYKFILSKAEKNLNWKDIYFDKTNNLKKFKYDNKNQVILKSKKLSKHTTNNYILFAEDNLITSDEKGNIIIYSLSEKKIITKFNFYKKKYKKISKTLNLIIEKKIIYISDNIGYLYAFDYKKNKILWAKNYKIPFRSNIKIFKNKLIASNQNNELFFFNKKNGDILKLIPTEETIVKNQFINNLSLNDESLFFLNNYGSLYSINNETMKMEWFINLNQSLDLNPSNIFFGIEIISYKDKIIVSSNQFTYSINVNTGFIGFKKNFSAVIKPIIIDNYLFLITRNNLLVSMNLDDNSIIYSVNINEKIADFLNTKKSKVQFKDMMVLNKNIYVFLKNSFIVKFNFDSSIQEIIKLPSKIKSQPIIIDNLILYLNNKNRLLAIN